MFSKPLEFIGFILISFLIIWISAMVLTSSPCTRVHRSGWPVWYMFGAVEFVSQNWTSDDTKLTLLSYKTKSTIAVQQVALTTLYGKDIKCKL